MMNRIWISKEEAKKLFPDKDHKEDVIAKEIKDAKQEHHNSGDNYSCDPLSPREDS